MAVKKINPVKEFIKGMRAQGRVETLDKPEHLAAVDAMNEQLEIFRREYLGIDARVRTGLITNPHVYGS
ncbi:MAG: hypothetical protein LBR41_02030 [Rickettsiales bacterium]|jgi:hypothetical protein|nr:hypothetical protein [Rickettsiales bacterium]